MSFTQNLRHSRISAFSKKNKGHYFVDRSGFLFRFLDLRNLCHSSGGDCCVHMAAVQIRVPPPRKTLENGWPFEPVGIFIFFLGQFLGLIRHIRNCWLINWSTLVDILGKEVAIGEIPSIHQRGKFLVDKNLAKRHNDAKRNDVTCTAWVSVLFFFWDVMSFGKFSQSDLYVFFKNNFQNGCPWVMFEDRIIKISGYVLEYLRTVRWLKTWVWTIWACQGFSKIVVTRQKPLDLKRLICVLP